MSRKDEWEAEKRTMEMYYRAITSRKTHIYDIPISSDELAYTTSKGDIYEARNHPIMIGLSEEERVFFRLGTFTHEMLHQIFTDFAYLEETLEKHPWIAEKEVTSLMANLVEDPAIEYGADTVVGGEMLASLQFSIAHIYKMSPRLETSDNAFTQLCNALIQFGDMGLLKGSFTFKAAYDMFCRIAPEFNSAVIEPDPRARIDYAVRWMDMTRPLWEKDNLKEEAQFLSSLKKTANDNAITKTEGSGSPAPMQKKSEEGDVEKRRKRLLKKLEENEGSNESQGAASEKGAEAESDDGRRSSENEDVKEQHSESGAAGEEQGSEADENEERSGEEQADGKRDNGEDDDGEPGGEERQSSDSGDADKSEGGDSDSSSGTGKAPEPWDKLGEFELDDDGVDKIEYGAKELEKKHLEGVIDSLKKSATEITKKRLANDISYDSKSKYYGKVHCLNERVTVKKEDRNAFQSEYARIIALHARDISLLKGSLARIFTEDTGEVSRTTSGKYNVVRAARQSTARIFDRRRDPKQLDSLAVMLLIDESGSMYGVKEQMARETAVVLAETFAALHIPCYIMGFTTGKSYDAIHHHFVSWNNTREERISLVGLQASASNFDGYSIRNAASILQKKNAEHKILFVVSDGYPACRKYKSMSDGIADTATAISEAKRTATVLGIGIGDCTPETLRHMYRGAFVHAENPQDLSVTLTQNLKKIIKNF